MEKFTKKKKNEENIEKCLIIPKQWMVDGEELNNKHFIIMSFNPNLIK